MNWPVITLISIALVQFLGAALLACKNGQYCKKLRNIRHCEERSRRSNPKYLSCDSGLLPPAFRRARNDDSAPDSKELEPRQIKKYGQYPVIAGFIAIGALIAYYWISTDTPPFRTLYETYLLLAFCVAGAGIAAGYFWQKHFITASSGLISAVILLFAAFNVSPPSSALPPFLQSIWFIPHVLAYFCGYALILLACIASLRAIFSKQQQQEMFQITGQLATLALVFITCGLCFGSIWANDAWGSWWNWDPKENLALVQWLLLAAFIHTPLQSRYSVTGVTLLILTLLITVLMYLGITFLPLTGSSSHVNV